MISRILSVWYWFGSNRPGFFSGTLLLVILMLSVYAGGIQASLSLGPEGDFPRFRDVLLNALSHDDSPSLLVDVGFLLLTGPCQERRWGTVAFLALSALTAAALPCAYALVLFVGGGEASRVCGYSGVQLALFTAQCRQVTRRRPLGRVPLWLLPWLALLLGLLVLPGTPALLHFCAICIGHNYHQSFIGTLQELEQLRFFDYIPDWAYVSASARLRLPTYSASHSSPSQTLHREEPVPSVSSHHSSWSGTAPAVSAALSATGTGPVWARDQYHGLTEAELLEEQMLRAGILASLRDAPDSPDVRAGILASLRDVPDSSDVRAGILASLRDAPDSPDVRAGILASLRDVPDSSDVRAGILASLRDAPDSPDVRAGILASLRDFPDSSESKVEVSKSSVSSLRLQQLERMGFPTEKAVVALAASRQLEGAVSLLIDDSIGEEAVVVGAKAPGAPQNR